MTPAPPLMNVDEYFRTPETVKPMELVFGALRVAESPSPRHQSVVSHLFRALDAHVRLNKLGQVWFAPLDIVLNERKALVVQPDLFFISEERSYIVTDHIRGAPDLVVEVLSPRPRIGQVDERVRWFAENGVRECWLVHQDQASVAVLRFEGARATVSQVYSRRDAIVSDVLPGFRASLDDILEA